MSRPRGWLCTPLEAEAATLSNWLKPEAERLAIAIAWGRSTEFDALWEMHVVAASMAEKAKMECDSRTVAQNALADARHQVAEANDRTFRAARAAADKAMAESGDREAARQAAIGIARSHWPRLPYDDVSRAVRQAIRGRRVMA